MNCYRFSENHYGVTLKPQAATNTERSTWIWRVVYAKW